MAASFKKAFWLLHELSATVSGGRCADTELSWTNWERTVSCHQEAIRDWDKSMSSEGAQTRQMKARSSSVCRRLTQKDLKGVGRNLMMIPGIHVTHLT